ncbi:hypothetical protein DHEL01_v201311 [Diaporthe helianthi]|uniref:O-methyltransferase C-terminal domain-containing protein n=1 Tax=Diaporthe helianthi TaxID=158607 RepID=A0A2P5ICS0_DIAHE|nr:hypothetical protein DHEL01_v201311 [Diaporthe helianthi]
MSGRNLLELGEEISGLTQKIAQDLQTQGQTIPSINDTSSPTGTGLAVDAGSALKLAEAARELEALVLGPHQALGLMGLSVHDASSLGVIAEFDIARLVPIDGSATFAELSAQTGIDEDRLTRILRYATTNYIFREQPPGHIRHTTLSAHLARLPATVAFQRVLATVFNPANASLPAALRRHPNTASMTRTAHNEARGTELGFYAWLDTAQGPYDDDEDDDDEKGASASMSLRAVFDAGMEGISRGGQRLQDTDLRAFPWATVLPRDATVVDVGGSRGHFVRDLGLMNPLFRVVVQDLPRVVEGLAGEFGGDGGGEGGGRGGGVTGNVTYQAHDFFNEQPVVGADVYFLRHVMHNHPDEECVAILRALLPALRGGGRVLVSEYVVPPAGELTGGLSTKAMRQMDLMTMALFNAKERTRDEYAVLFERASERLVLKGTHQVPDDPTSCIFEAVYTG